VLLLSRTGLSPLLANAAALGGFALVALAVPQGDARRVPASETEQSAESLVRA
jgi:hypothetical protein